MVDLIELLKWVAVVFIAGFIGYFGRYLSKLIIARLHRAEVEEHPGRAVVRESGVSERELDLEKARLNAEGKKAKYRYKLEKKRLKAEKKEEES